MMHVTIMYVLKIKEACSETTALSVITDVAAVKKQ